MPSEPTFLNALARLFRPNNYRETFRVLSDSLEHIVIIFSAEEYQIQYCNHAFLLLSGYSRTEIEKLAFSEILPQEDREGLQERLLRCVESHDHKLLDFPILNRSGEVIPLDLRLDAVGRPVSTYLLIGSPSSTREIKQNEQQARESRLDLLIQMSTLITDGMVGSIPSVLDFSKQLLSASNVGLYRVSATAPDYILEGNLPQEFPPILPTSDLNPLQRSATWTLGERAGHILHKSARSSGYSLVQTELIGAPAAWIGVLVVCYQDAATIPADIELLLKLLANLLQISILLSLQRASVAESESLISQLEAEIHDHFISVKDGLIKLDGDLKVIQANPALWTLLGYKPDEVIGLPIEDVLVGPENIRASLLDALGHHRIAEQLRITLHRRDGIPIPVDLRATPLSPEARARLMVIIRDQSEQQEIEDQTEMLAQRALLGEVAAIFAHEVRNPINNISTGVQLIASRLGEEHPQYESLERIHKECNRLDQLMSDVLFFSRPLKLDIQPIDLSEVLHRNLSRWSPRLNQLNIECHTSFNPKTPYAFADERTLERVIVNLITNSIQAMSDGGTLSISLDPIDTAQGKMVEMKVIDTGPGIPADVKDRIFDPFFTTKKDGTGLGLAISRRILTAHKGNIQVDSYTDAGTIFTLSLPAMVENEEEHSNERDRSNR